MEKFKNFEKIGDGTYGTVLKSINDETSINSFFKINFENSFKNLI